MVWYGLSQIPSSSSTNLLPAMSQQLLKNNITFCNRIVRGAGFFFGNTRIAQVRLNQWRVANHKGREDVPSTYAEFREALGIKSDKAWLEFMVGFVNSYSVVRERSATFNWSRASVAEKLDANSMSESEKQTTSKPSSSSSQSSSGDPLADSMQQAFAGKPSSQPSSQQTAAIQSALKDMEKNLDAVKAQMLAERKAADEALAALKKQKSAEAVVRVIIENRTTSTTTDLRMQHRTLPDLIVSLRAEQNVFLVGPAGSGKTTGAMMAAKALGLEFGFMSVGPQTTKTDILGYMSATGSYVTTEFRKRFEHGGVFLFDEIDAGNGGVMTCVNAALAGDFAAFPDAIVKKHPKFLCIAAGNTYGTGPDRVYVGRQELDGASIDRYDQLEWGYDEAMETALGNAVHSDLALHWTPYVQAARKAVNALNLRYIISPRAVIGGIKLLREGRSWEQTKATRLWKSMKADDVKRVEAEMVRQGFKATKPEVVTA